MASGRASTRVGTGREEGVVFVAGWAKVCSPDSKLPEAPRTTAPKALKIRHFHADLPTMNVPPPMPAASHSGGILTQSFFAGYWSRVHNWDSLGLSTVSTLRGRYRTHRMERRSK